MRLSQPTVPAELTIELAVPLKSKGGQVTELKLREPTANETHRAEGFLQSGAGAEATTLYIQELVTLLTGIPKEALEDLPISKLGEAGSYFTAFIDANLELKDIDPEGESPPAWELELPKPISHQGMDYYNLSLQEPATGAVRKAQTHLRKGVGSQTLRAYQMWLVTNATGVPHQVVQALPISVLNAAAIYLQGFINPGLRTGPV